MPILDNYLKNTRSLIECTQSRVCAYINYPLRYAFESEFSVNYTALFFSEIGTYNLLIKTNEEKTASFL